VYGGIRDDSLLLHLDNVIIRYKTLEGTVYAVNGISLDVGKGEALGLVGETGAGKTTTALSVMGLLPKQGILDGRILFDGESLTDMEEKEYRNIRGNSISMVFQDPMSSLNPIFTVVFQIAETAKLHQNVTKKEAVKLAIEMLRAVGISEDRAYDYPHEFSGGMIQRVMIAIALVCRPRLLILDEPTTALDVTIQAQVLGLLRDLKKTFSTSMIFITHNLAIVPEICETIAIMYGGRIVETGRIASVYSNPLHPYTVNLFKCIPDIDDPWREIKPMPGSSFNPRMLPEGCLFYSRCHERSETCISKEPPLVEIEPGHSVACMKYMDQRDE
jgi:peptide/nickel transport system ATP-binding protein